MEANYGSKIKKVPGTGRKMMLSEMEIPILALKKEIYESWRRL